MLKEELEYNFDLRAIFQYCSSSRIN